jgi:hypothetical protein
MVTWRTRPARSRLKPFGFIAPCLPILSDEIPVGPSWIHELKWDVTASLLSAAMAPCACGRGPVRAVVRLECMELCSATL